ncbi:MAG: Cysteine desulfurase [Eubacteriales bacterium SKADARSKE-1]|nr:Cysteine desulfurase [Eubacteriales bacterium SKADARSKE-1]
MREIYLDNSATTQVSEKTIEKAVELMRQKYGNPSSLHAKGLEAQNEVENARKIIAKTLNCDQTEIYFTSGGTEANNLAVFGAAKAMKKRGNKIVTTAIEHSSVYESLKELENSGFEVVYLKPDIFGMVTKEQFMEEIDENTILVTVMMVNNEVGSILPVDQIRECIDLKKSPALFHVDAVQAFGKMPINISKIKPDLLSLSSHKIHGPKGVGALFKSKSKRIYPRAFGGEQQDKVRPGTESAPLIAALGVAVSEIDIESNYKKVLELRNYLVKKLNGISEITLNSGPDSLPYIVNFSVENIKAETMLHFLASHNIYVSGGSACAKGKASRVLKKLGIPDERVTSSIRVSFSKYNSKEDIDALIEGLLDGIKSLVKIKE